MDLTPLIDQLKIFKMFFLFLFSSNRFCKSSDDTKRAKVSQILERLINLTIEQKEMYPSIQAKIWGSIGQVSANVFKKSFLNLFKSHAIIFLFISSIQIPELIDMVLDNSIQKSVVSGLGSPQVEIMTDTAVAIRVRNFESIHFFVEHFICDKN